MNEEYINLVARINALGRNAKECLTSIDDKYYVMAVKPYNFFCYTEEQVPSIFCTLDVWEAKAFAELMNAKHGEDDWYEYAVFKMSMEHI